MTSNEDEFNASENSVNSLNSKLNTRIVLDPSITQPENVFTPETYREFLRRWRQEWERSDYHWEPVDLLIKEFERRLPIHLLARCPYCDLSILQPFDSFSLVGFHNVPNISDRYHGRPEWIESKPPSQRCSHAVLATLAINFNGLKPDDIPGWVQSRTKLSLKSYPQVMVWPLIARQTSAVIHALPIGRLDDPEPIHRYTAYVVTYFASDSTNLYTPEMLVTSDYGLATEGVTYDTDLLKWVRAGRLFWLDPDDSHHPLVRGTADVFPYRFARKGGCSFLWGLFDGSSGYDPPPHDQSYPKTIE